MIHHSTEQFRYDRASRLFTADAAELTRGGIKRLFDRIYADACDSGFAMISHLTGKNVVYAVYEEHRNADQDVTHWTLKPTLESIKTVPSCEGTAVIIYND